MSLSINFPTTSPTLLLDFANAERLDPRITFTRASTATYYGTRTALAEQNLLLQSQDFTTSWSNSNNTVTADTVDTTAPDGTSTAEKVTLSAGTFAPNTQQSVTSESCVFSVFAKKGTHNFIQLLGSGASLGFANFDLDAGTTSATTATSQISSVGNGWYRCVIVFAAGIVFSNVQIRAVASLAATRAASSTYAGTETYYLWGAQLEQRSTVTAYTPTTTQAITNYIPVLETAASGVARFDHNPTTFDSLGLLIEEQRTNLLLRSAEFDNAYWTKTRSTITANAVVAPDGLVTADKLVEDTTASASHPLVSTSVTVAASATSTFSVYAKAGERSAIVLRLNNASDSVWCAFNLSTGAVGTALNSGTGSGATGAITSAGDGWYRCSLTGVTSTTASSIQTIVYPAVSTTDPANTSIIYTGDGYSGLYLWGAQLEAGAFPTSYIPTVAAAATRAADVLVMTGTNFSSWYNASEGTIIVSGRPILQAANQVWLSISDNTTNERMRVVNTSASQVRFSSITGGVESGVMNKTATITASAKLAAAYKLNDDAFSLNGDAVTTDTSVAVPVVSQMDIGSDRGLSIFNGWLQQVAYYPTRLPNTQLQALTL